MPSATCSSRSTWTPGEKGWSGKVADGGLFDSAISVELSITGHTLVVGRSKSGTAYDVCSGKKLWDKKKYGGELLPHRVRGRQHAAVARVVRSGTDTEHDEVQELDPTTGKAKWTPKFDKGWKVPRAYSVDPLVVYITNDETKKWNISALDGNGRKRSQVEAATRTSRPDAAWSSSRVTCRAARAPSPTPTRCTCPTRGDQRANEVVAFNLATGKEKWRVKSPADNPMMPMKVEGRNLIAYVEPSYDAGGRVVSIPTTGGGHKPTKLLRNPQGAAKVEGSFFSKALDCVDGRFYISTTRLSGNDEAKEKLMLAYGK